jgi:serine/threonine-protein kinase
MVARFISEARAVNQIRHKNIIDIFSFGVLPDGRQFFVMELLDGTPLENYLEAHGAMPFEQAAPVLRAVARALGAAHANGITHRDIKPENVFLCIDDEGNASPKLLDFGIAKLVVDKNSQHKTRSGVPMGTPLYMSPEQVHGKDVDFRSDIYSFGIMAFQMLTGRIPFDGESMMEVMMKQLNAEPPLPSSFNPAIPAELDAPLLAMLAKDPAKRPQSIVDAVEAVLRVGGRGDAGTTARLPPIQAPSKREFAPGSTALFERNDTLVASSIAGLPERKLSPLVIVGAVAAVGSLLGLGAFLFFGSKPEVASSEPSPAPAESAPAPIRPEPTSAPTMTVLPSLSPSSSNVSASSASPVEQTVSIELAVVPTDAEIFDGDKRIGKAGEVLKLPRGTTALKLTVKRANYLPQVVTVVPDQDRKEGPITLKAAGGKPKEYGEF